jgi:hypothetical protein
MRAYSLGAAPVGLYSVTQNGSVSVADGGGITVSGFAGEGIRGVGFGTDNTVQIENTGDIFATGDQSAVGIRTQAGNAITIENHGDILARTNSPIGGQAFGIYAYAKGPISVDNSGDITVVGTASGRTHAIYAYTRFGVSPVAVVRCASKTVVILRSPPPTMLPPAFLAARMQAIAHSTSSTAAISP